MGVVKNLLKMVERLRYFLLELEPEPAKKAGAGKKQTGSAKLSTIINYYFISD